MTRSLIAAGGALLTAAALFGSAGPAAADDEWHDRSHKNSHHCGLWISDDRSFDFITKDGIFTGKRDSDACKDGWKHTHHDDDKKWDWHDD
ncbi:hypothetical protein E1286_39075 [Nonomuraea terrae]|uniref:Lipoprotein n=1 Tax=Nonomuraea terrae TaxID=2530383 RepID=A0A4R4XVN2_9ACTN|nr:hypothetical protein [Nonomuraea terrae]TDD35788.1 hypothetical protein E1286_39075 [Nonomuraea terrae]